MLIVLADVYTTIAVKLPQITFTCASDDTTIQTMCESAPNGIPNIAKKFPLLLVKTDIGSLALCKNHVSQDYRSAALPIAHELVEMAKQTELDRRAEAVIQQLAAIDKHAQHIIEALRDLLLSLDDYYITNFWRRTMKWYSEIMDRIEANLA